MDRTKTVLGLLVLVLASTVGWEGYVLAVPSPTISRVVTPGVAGGGACTWSISLDGTTPVAQANIGGLSISPGDNLVGTAGQDIGAWLNSFVVGNERLCFSTGSFQFTSAFKPPTNVAIYGAAVQYVSPPTGTVFKLNPPATAIINQTGTAGGHIVGFQLQNIYFDGGNNAAGNAVWLKFVSNVIIMNTYFINFGQSAVYLDSAFNGFISNIQINTCGASGATHSCIYMGGSQAVSDFSLDGIAMSTMNAVGEYIDANTADVKIVNQDFDENAVVASATNVQIQLAATSTRIHFANIETRTIASGVSMINDQSVESDWANLWQGNGLGVGFNRGGAGLTTISNLHQEGVGSGANRLTNGLYVPLGNVIVSGYTYSNVITPFFTNAGGGVLSTWGMSPIVATSTVTAGASVWTFTNTDGYLENLYLTNLNGGTVSAWTCNGLSGWPTTVSSIGCSLTDSQSMTVTWATTAPTFTKVPYG